MNEPLRIGVLGAARITGLALITPAGITGDRVVAVVGTAGEATATNFVRPDQDDRVRWVGRDGTHREEHLGTRSSYTYQLEAFRAHLRAGAPLPIDVDDAVSTAELIDAVYAAAGFPPRPTAAR